MDGGACEKRRLVWIFRVACFLHFLLTLAIAHLYSASVGETVFSLIVGIGGWVGCYLYFSKEIIHLYSLILKHGENPVYRAIALCIALVAIIAAPGSLYG